MKFYVFVCFLVSRVLFLATVSHADSVPISLSIPSTLGDIEFLNFRSKNLLNDTSFAPHVQEGSSLEIKHLVIVTGHAVMNLLNMSSTARDDFSWFLLHYQRGQGLPEVIRAHIMAAVEIVAGDPNAVLMFSGGETRDEPYSEALSYYLYAKWNNWLNAIPSNRVVLEKYARDSPENMLFGMCRFKEVHGYYPSRVTVVGFDFKEQRFDMHRAAMGIPVSTYSYVGVAPHAQFNKTPAEAGEAATRRSFETDPYGCHDASLRNKRRERDSFSRTVPYLLACPEMAELLTWCEPHHFMGPLPWRNRNDM